MVQSLWFILKWRNYSVHIVSIIHFHTLPSLVGYSCRIQRLHLCRGVTPPPECPGYDIKQSDGEASTLEIWENVEYPFIAITARSTLIAPDRVLSMGQLEQTVCANKWHVKLWLLYSNTWSHLTVYKKELKLI